MPDSVTNELLLEHLKALQDDAENARTERREIREELWAIKDHISALRNDFDRDIQHGTELARKVATLDN